jgi:hypothetical protein
MLHYSHKLNDIIAQFLDSREDIRSEFRISTHAILRRRDSHYLVIFAIADGSTVCFVDSDRFWFWRGFILEDVFFWGIPENGIVDR